MTAISRRTSSDELLLTILLSSLSHSSTFFRLAPSVLSSHLISLPPPSLSHTRTLTHIHYLQVGAHEKVLEIFATKKVAASQMDEVGLSVLIKSCDRLGDAEWAVTILKEAIKAVRASTVRTLYTLNFSISVHGCRQIVRQYLTPTS